MDRRRILLAQNKKEAGGDLPQWFLDPLVCWYDVPKQGYTNDDFKKNPILIDFNPNPKGIDGKKLNIGLRNFNFDGVENGITKEYPNGLTFNGKRNFALTDQKPKLSDYTVIANRIRFDKRSDSVLSSCGRTDTSAFLFEGVRVSFSFGSASNITPIENNFTYQTSHYYNKRSIIKGPAKDKNYLYVGSTDYSEGFFWGVISQYLLFNRTLEENEINWVKNNIIRVNDL